MVALRRRRVNQGRRFTILGEPREALLHDSGGTLQWLTRGWGGPWSGFLGQEAMTETPTDTALVARQVEELVGRLDLAVASREDVAAAARQITRLGREAVAVLARGIFRRGAGRREKVSALLACLEGEPARWAFAELERDGERRALNPTERMWLLLVLRRLQEAAYGRERSEAREEVPEHLLTDESELLLWRDELAGLSEGDQEAALAPILQDGNAAFLPLIETVTSLRNPRLDAMIAGALARFATQAALPLVRELLRRPDPTVRKRARETLLALERQGVDTRGVFVAASESDEPLATALATRPDAGGRVAILLARGRAPGRIRYAVVIVDPVEAGIFRVWGESGLTHADLQQRIREYTRQGGQEFLPIDPATAQALVAAGEDYARSRGKDLPADYAVWRRCIGRPKEPVELPLVFGPACSECGSRIRGGDISRGGMVVGRVALCAKCAGRPRICAACNRPLDRFYDDFFVREGTRAGTVEFVCSRCAQRANKK